MSDRPDIDEAIQILQAGGFKIAGGKYAPDANLTSDNQPTTPEPDEVLGYTPHLCGHSGGQAHTCNCPVGHNHASNQHPTPLSTADKVCPVCGRKLEWTETPGFSGMMCPAPELHTTGRIAGTSTPDEVCDAYEHTPLWGGDGYYCTKCGTPFTPKVDSRSAKDVQPVSPNGDDLDSAIIQLYLDGVNEKNIKALIAQRVLRGRIDELQGLLPRLATPDSVQGAFDERIIGERLAELTKDLK